MIGFYLTKTGEYDPTAIADISSAIILDDRNKKMQVMGEYNFDFQVLDASYTSTVDASAKGLSIYGAGLMYADVLGYVDDTVHAWIPDSSRTAYNTAAAQTHTHANKDLLDGVTDASIEDWVRDTSYDQGTLSELNTGTNTEAKVWDASTIHGYVEQNQFNAVRFRGDFNAETGVVTDTGGQTLVQLSEKKGDMFVVSTAGTYLNHEMQVGDSIIFKSACGAGVEVTESHLTFVQGVVKAVAENPTLTWDTSSKIGEVEGVDFYVKMPAMPTKADLGLGNVENKSAAAILSELSARNVSTALGYDPQSAEDVAVAINSSLNDALGTAAALDFSTGIDTSSTSGDLVTAEAVATFVEGKNYGSVYSVSMTVPTGLSVSGSPITTAGTLDVSLETGYAIPKNSSLSNFQTAYGWGDHSLVGYAMNNTLVDLSTRINARVANVSSYETDLSTRINARVANVSTYAINVSTYSSNVSTYAHNVNTSVNSKFDLVDASMQNIFDINSSQESIWAAAWNQLFDLNPDLVRPSNY